jgi:hypothetical protein
MAGIPNKTSDRTQEPSLIMLCLPVVLWMCWHHSLTLDPLPGGGEGEEIIKARTDNASNFVEASAAGIAVDHVMRRWLAAQYSPEAFSWASISAAWRAASQSLAARWHFGQCPVRREL